MKRKHSKQKNKMGCQCYLQNWKSAMKRVNHANNLASRNPWLPGIYFGQEKGPSIISKLPSLVGISRVKTSLLT